MRKPLTQWSRLCIPGRLNLEAATIFPGFTALLGPSGCGKSSLLQVLAGFLPSSHALPSADWMPQDFGLWPGCSILEHLQAAAGTHADRVTQWLEGLDLRGIAQRRVEGCSIGEQARCAFGRALCGSAPVLLLDEALAHLDAERRPRYWQAILEDCRARNRSLLYACHTPDQLLTAGGNLLWMEAGGSIAWAGEVSTFYHEAPNEKGMHQLGQGFWVDDRLRDTLHLSRSGAFRPEQLCLHADAAGLCTLVGSQAQGPILHCSIRILKTGELLSVPLLNTPLPAAGSPVSIRERAQ